jgi:hypothetical protein
MNSFFRQLQENQELKSLTDDTKDRLRKRAKVWDAQMPYDQDLLIDGSTYSYPYNLFPDISTFKTDNLNSAKEMLPQCAVSECGKWVYARRMFPAWNRLPTASGRITGSVRFTTDVELPAVWELRNGVLETWMSFTPFEVFTLRGGIRRAKGHTVVGGLGMGYQLIEIAKRKQVSKITVIEQSKGVIDFLFERIKSFCPADKEIEIINDNIHNVIGDIYADVAVIDTFPRYGCNRDELDRMRVKNGSKIPSWWGWGTAELE